MLYLVSYAFHLLVSVLFFVLIPFPYLIKGSLLDEPGRFALLLKIYKRIIWLAHGGVVVSIITGFLMTSQWMTVWFFLVLIIWLVLSAMLGMTAKPVRIILEKVENNQDASDDVSKLRLYSFMLMIAILSMFLLKIVLYI
ncbi:hypothetical protein JCM9140_287 [Halalkalibacter wakoensis JCM 9140]|uniref:DUF2269 family protein n=1 Tax=Halalkalibacter wakoensis JCM 9140 TaxID=1236970 RepID=W4PXF6_9BACI|nr:hypothetical protein [Halalkalibacter wakoensis]GAE24370.1 hypothetical protein JCM9140_287 [Halalkalibacter wakoensis JCM 9140]